MTNSRLDLGRYLADWAREDRMRRAVAAVIGGVARACVAISARVAQGALASDPAAERGRNAQGEAQKELDLFADLALIEAARAAPVALYASEEIAAPAELAANALLVLAVDPLDGSSNIGANVAVGTIFSVLPAERARPGAAEPAFPLPGARQLAAGYVIYGPRTELVLSVGEGTHAFTLDPRSHGFCLTRSSLTVAPETAEFAINMSNYRHWEETVRAYADDCLKGTDGPRGKDYNMRWIASLVAEAHRILGRGGVFLYPADARQGYAAGRLRLVYEANPIAFLIEQAGGAAIDGERRILDLDPGDMHRRTPLIFGARNEVARLQGMFHRDHALGARSPLFGRRGLFRA